MCITRLRERGLYVGIRTWLCTFTYPCQPIEGEGTVIPLINLSPENEKTLGKQWVETDKMLPIAVNWGEPRRPGGRCSGRGRGGGKSELHRTGCPLTAGRGDPTESAAETYRSLSASKGEKVR